MTALTNTTEVITEGPKAKRAHTKSKTGCKNCKARKIKCDETRPLCRNCERHYSNITECEWTEDTSRAPKAKSDHKPHAQTKTDDHANRGADRISWHDEALKIMSSLRVNDYDSNSSSSPESSDPPRSASYADQLILEYDALEQHFNSFPFVRSSSITKAWWPFAREDIVLFHVLLVLSDRKLRKLDRIKDTEKVGRMMSLTHALLNERLMDPVMSTKDETIATVSHLAAIEHERGDIKALRSRISCLKRLVASRGGMEQYQASSPLMANFTAWVALITASDPFLVPSELQFDENKSIHPCLAALSEPLRYDFDADGVDAGLTVVLADVDILSQQFNTVISQGQNADPAHSTAVTSAVVVTIQKCLKFAYQYDTPNPREALSAAVAIAGAMHLIAPVGGSYPDSSHVMNSLMHKLKQKLAVLIDAEVPPTPLLFWLLFCGGVSSVFLPNREFFIRHLAAVSKDMGIYDWTQARVTCATVMAHAILCETVFCRLWAEVEEKMRALDDWNARMEMGMFLQGLNE